ncbi:MAG: hypothetical protein NT165_03745 [Candidatus Falkowbacteria bacterium]|nr:hypothetical protein [Candidatus Falkowbacteria bacterium]
MRSEILNALYVKLSNMEGIEAVFKYNKGHFTKFPTAVILGSDNTKQRESIKTVKKTYKFKVQIFQEINQEARGQESGEDVVIAIGDRIDDMFDEDDTLGGVCDDVSVISSYAWDDRELLMRVLQLEVVCTKLKQLI